MEFDNVNNLIPKEGERYIIVENGQPTKVVLSFEDYKKMAGNPGEPANPVLEMPASSLPEPTVEELQEEGAEKTDKELTLEDLPF